MTTTSRAQRDRLRFDRLDRLATTVVLWFVVGGAAAYPLFVALDWALRRQVTLTGVPVDLGPQAAGVGEVVGGPAEAVVLVRDVGPGHFTLLMLSAVLAVVAAVWGAVLLSRFLRDLGAGAPFASANVRRLRVVALLLMLVPPVSEAVYSLARGMIVDAAGGEGFMLTFTPGWLVAGLLVAAVAQAFAAGTRLQDDVEGLV
ncbi:DUF2975 domain-containing protein [Ornithinimicrobium cerasi]|uniref:DUF2975 domain-containing protein n=1 Tax=Ornithinimicrobium cerasi TaxID=2248773 RepID=A0A285VWQ2_9MICO|nr:DUF2975 domain-containing protein [Ornithinimicrobium cerasi]SOC57071.1 Protein of unknown function [Ornithinimicrobium cerasi]